MFEDGIKIRISCLPTYMHTFAYCKIIPSCWPHLKTLSKGMLMLTSTCHFSRFLFFPKTFLAHIIGNQVKRCIAVTPRVYRKFYRPQNKFSKQEGQKNATNVSAAASGDEDSGDEDDIEDNSESMELQRMIERSLYINEMGHQVFVIQPRVKWGRNKNELTTPQLQLDEAVTLIKTLRNWKVVGKKIISVERRNKFKIFGTGQLTDLRNLIVNNKQITAVFVSINMLKPAQQGFLQSVFGVPVYDRYTIVIHIFRNHATTKEAKLQIKLAELPFLRSRLTYIGAGGLDNFGGQSSLMGTVWKGREFHDQLLKQRESKIREKIMKLRTHRQNIRKNRVRSEIPIVAVVGYTNSGKTSLIKALTGRDKLQPQDYLFATLDVTVHEGRLPSSMKVLYVDTIGFISDIPTSLFESFTATLEDAALADVIIHVRDISHPDTVAQNQNVINTLKLLEIPEKLSKNMLTVGNKIDLLSNEDINSYSNEDMILVSASKEIGTGTLKSKIEEYILEATGRKIIVVRVRTSGDEYCWLFENATVVSEKADPNNNNYMLVTVIITNVSLSRFKHIFISDYVKTR